MNKRILWVDVAKAIGIYFIVLGHVLTTGTLRRWIFAFHVPLFFFLAGVTLKTNSTWMDFVKKKAKGLLIPYISFSFVSMAIYEVMVAFLGMKGEKLKFPRDLLVVLYGNSRPDIMKWNTPLWFLPCLFAVSLIIYLLERVINKVGGQRLRILIIIAFLAGSILGEVVN